VADDSSSTTQPRSSSPKVSVVEGQIIGERYRVGAVLGEGGMGVVCSATHVLLGTAVAIKLVHADLLDDAEAVQRFVNEARTTASLKGEHIARVFDVGQLETGEPYLVMEQLDGVGLDEYLRQRGPLSQAEAVDIVLQACEGLAEAHAVSLVHRDVKPANLFLARRPDGLFKLKILDFGISKRLASKATRNLTNPGKSLGSPWYMSPEQMLSASLVDQRADVWSLGVLLFELLTNRYPFDGDNVPQVCAAVLTAPAPSLIGIRPDIAPELESVVLACLEKQPEKRISSVTELALSLQPFASAPVPNALSLTLAEPAPIASESTAQGRLVPAEPLTLGTLAPIIELRTAPVPPAQPAQSNWLTTVALACLLVAVAGFAWPFFRDQYRAPAAGEPSRLQLPWTPQLLPAATDTSLREAPSSAPPTLLQRLEFARAFPEPERTPAPVAPPD
jgi:serine/threonine protein kinase